jgi:hypothetical protein
MLIRDPTSAFAQPGPSQRLLTFHPALASSTPGSMARMPRLSTRSFTSSSRSVLVAPMGGSRTTNRASRGSTAIKTLRSVSGTHVARGTLRGSSKGGWRWRASRCGSSHHTKGASLTRHIDLLVRGGVWAGWVGRSNEWDMGYQTGAYEHRLE